MRPAPFDLVVIGGGAAGLTAAREGVRRGARTAIVQEGPLGGDCTFTGCVPSKALLTAAARGDRFVEAMEQVRRAVARVAASENDQVLEREGIEVLHGRGRLVSRSHVEVNGHLIGAERIILATGARPAVPSIGGVAELDPLTSETVFSLDTLPRSLVVVGGGATGCELAQAFARLGSSVSLVELERRLLPREEPETSEVVAGALRADGVVVRTGARVVGAEPTIGGSRVLMNDRTAIEGERVLAALGRRPNTEHLGLAEAAVALDEQGFVRTDAAMATTTPGIWAAGDITGRMPFTHAAARMAFVAVANACSSSPRLHKARFDPRAIPWVTFTDPEVGRVGMTEAQAAAHGGRVAELPLAEIDRAVITRRTRGFVKLIAGPRRLLRNVGGGKLLGATVVAPGGGEIIHEVALAMHAGMFTGRLAQTTHAYPAWSTALQRTAAQFFFEFGGRSARPANRSPDLHGT